MGIKTPPKFTRTFTLFVEHGIMSEPMMAKPMKTLELHYPMIQFLITTNSLFLLIRTIRSFDVLISVHLKRVVQGYSRDV